MSKRSSSNTPAAAAGALPPPSRDDLSRGPRGTAGLICLALIAALVFAGFFALGTWQVQRRTWKLDLIARVDQRAHAAPTTAPGPENWPRVNANDDEYRRVKLSGTFLYDREARVQASTDLGSGFWIMTPLRQQDGTIVLVNRGFIPAGQRDAARQAPATAAPNSSGQDSVTGLLRMTEPGGGFLRKNDPAGDRWFSRDVQAIAAARGLSPTAPYFVDAEAAPPGTQAANAPVGGLTVIAFHNSHLVYAITWYALALMVAGAVFHTIREERRVRRRLEGNPGRE